MITKFAARFCKPLLYSGLNAVKLDGNLPDPALPDTNWVKVKNLCCGVCGTDLQFFKSSTGTKIALEPMPNTYRAALGHETLGIVEEVGEAVTRFKTGDRVLMRAYMLSCDTKGIKEKCIYCARGDYSLCQNYGADGPYENIFKGGGFGDYYIAPESQLTKVFDELSDDQAVLVEPSAVSLHAVLRHLPEKGDKVMVFGAGTIGLGVIQWLKLLQPDCKVYVMERIPEKREFAKKLGADEIVTGNPYDYIAEKTGGKVYTGMFGNKMLIGGFDIIYDCVGTGGTVESSLRWLRARGTLVKIGTRLRPIKFDETPLWWQELTIVGVDSHGMEHFEGRDVYTFDLVQEFMRGGKYKTDGFITQRFNLSDYKKAFKIMVNNPPDHIKAVLDCTK